LGAFRDALWMQTYRLEDDMFQDMRYGWRMLLKRPSFTLLAVFILALGIGGSTSIFSAVNPVLFKSLPYPHPERIVSIWDLAPNGSHLDGTFGTYSELLERNRTLESIAVLKRWQPTMTGNFDPELLEGQMVTASYFQVLGQSPVLGRNFDPSENRVNAEGVVILSNKLWRRHFNGDPTIIGRQILLDESNYTVVGVMSPMFENVISQQGEVWAPIQYDMSQPRSWGHHLQIVARLLPGVSEKQARNDLSLIAESPIPEFGRPPWAALKQGLIVNSLQDDITSSVKPALLAVLGAVLLVLIIACVNVTNLLLARGAQRRGEFAVRSALGA